jgi:hypothetical protein
MDMLAALVDLSILLLVLVSAAALATLAGIAVAVIRKRRGQRD